MSKSKSAHSCRELCVRWIREIHELARKASTESTIRESFLARYSSVAKIAEDFENAHLKVIQETSEFEAEDVIQAEFDKMHYAVKGRYHALTGTPPGTVQAQPLSHTSAVKLPRITLPQFSGDLTLWPSFIALFNASIHDNRQTSSIEKYQYLLASLKGETLNLIKNLPFAAEYRNKRKLVDHHLKSIRQAKPLKLESADALHNLLDTLTENTRALNLRKFSTDAWDFILLNFLLEKLPRLLREKFESIHRTEEILRYAQLIKFLSEHCKVLEAVSGLSTFSTKSKSASVSSFVTHTADCPVCKEQHYVTKCSRFLKLSSRKRLSTARDLKLCINYLRSGHSVKNCPSAWSCQSCGMKHHTLLHFEQSSSSTLTVEPVTATPAAQDTATVLKPEDKPLVTMASLANSIVLLSTVRAEVIDSHGNAFLVRVLLDSASQANFVTKGCLRKGGFRRTKHSTTVFALNETKAATTKGLTSFVIRSRGRNDIRFPIKATVLPRITSPLPNSKVAAQSWNYLKGLSLADPEYYLPGNIDILLGAESFVSILRDGRRKGGDGEPDAFNTVFGWVLTSAVSPSLQVAPLHSFATTLESIETAVGQFCGHIEFISDPFPSDGYIYYLPHHGVYKLDSTTTKLRVVFNASSRCPNGLPINDTLLSGPKLQQDLFAILLRFRADPVALTADVKQMFRQIWVNPEQCDYQQDINRLKRNQNCSKPLRKLAPFLDTRGVLRVGGRSLHYILSQNFWVLGAHRAIKRSLSRCYQCFRANPTYCTTSHGGSATKSSLRCFIARRGRCSLIYSDCGTNFVGTQRELVNYMQAALEREQIQWSFNPPSTPHFGGFWKPGVKSMKTHLKRVVGAQILTVEFSTLITQIEAILNSRLLCPTSFYPNDLGVLSPGHFLTLKPLVAVPYPDLDPVPMSRLDLWQLVQHMHQQF
ncbi:uncharacterized protein LOC143908796 [Temnothorax americanus]|uniref:uncharacterized protein LOC143908796 n=1 Tax=Temnothorax americanus TaxID=1964332 RepID=UPI004069159A